MSHPWWGKEVHGVDVSANRRKLSAGQFAVQRPLLHTESASEIAAELRRRRPNYTPEWIDPADGDAGGALVELFATQLATVARRLNRLPDKALVEILDLAGIQPATERPSSALVQFNVAPAASESILLPKGFQVGARPATGSGDLVVFETQTNQFVAPTAIKKLIAAEQSSQRDITAANEDVTASFAPLGQDPQVGDFMLLGLAVPQNQKLKESLSFGIRVAAVPGNPPPVSAGGVAPLPLPVSPVLRWEALVKSQFVQMEVVGDETSNLWRSGIVTLRLPPGFTPRPYLGDETLFWLRLRLIHGSFEKPPQLSFIRVNMARVQAVRTIGQEVLKPIDDPTSNRMQLKNTPVLAKSLVLEVDQSVLSDDDDSNQRPAASRWKEVDELFSYGPTDQVFTLDSSTGIVTFGDGKHGSTVPAGFRNVRAAEYKVCSGAESAVGSDEITTLLKSAPFVTGVTNPLPASGGVGGESELDVIRRGPETIRSRHRSVTIADYAIMARFAPGADIRKAHALSGYHPQFPGQPIPGVVGILVVPQVEEEGPPVPDEQALRAVSQFLTANVAPIGVEVVAAAPTYRFIRAEVGFIADRGGNLGEIMQQISDELDRYLHPLTGGNDAEGWPFGGTLFYAELLQRLLNRIDRIRAIPRLRLIVNGVPQKRCGDIALTQTELLWPLSHQVIPMESEETP
ncbi:putative baseplate assembly protein [Stieleria varia]|uniref:Uncharacterized protein n=1 Tax=Stieleria varia TaxID=2528005 RepID=A0A5C5ZX90_9BACT|nr:putative baseplate assembly protein [Stieleria varia]TWT91746.1 hypothetical protein Pla52n_64960 [Stieleria varia]